MNCQRNYSNNELYSTSYLQEFCREKSSKKTQLCFLYTNQEKFTSLVHVQQTAANLTQTFTLAANLEAQILSNFLYEKCKQFVKTIQDKTSYTKSNAIT